MGSRIEVLKDEQEFTRYQNGETLLMGIAFLQSFQQL